MITPSFSLNFTTATLDPSVTFTRADATATRINSSGLVEIVAANTPRFNFDPITLACVGLLIEGPQTNLLTYSTGFENAVWFKSNTGVTNNAEISPDGTLNADKLRASSTNAAHFVQQLRAAAVNPYSFSVFLKAAEYTWAYLRGVNSAGQNVFAWFNLSNGTVNTVTSTGIASIQPFANGWYRCTLTIPLANAGGFEWRVGIAVSDNSTNFLGDDVSGIFVWGAQLESSSSPTSYIPTVAAQVTRNADVATVTGANFSNFWQASKGGAQVLALPSTVSGIRPLVQYDDGTANNIITLRGNTTNPELYVVNGGTPQAQLDAGTIVANTPYSLTGWWQTNDCKARKDSGAVVSDYTATIPTVTQARLGSDGTNYLNGTLATINYYDSFFGQPIYTRRKNKVFSSLF